MNDTFIKTLDKEDMEIWYPRLSKLNFIKDSVFWGQNTGKHLGYKS